MIDFCVAINGINLDYLVPMFFETFFEKVSVHDLHIHVVEKNVEDKIHQYIEEKKKKSPVPFTIHVLDEPFAAETGPPRDMIVWTGAETAYTCEWMVENCGDNDWMIISHFDIAFNNDVMKDIRKKIAQDVGMIGSHNAVHGGGLVVINRIAYNQCAVGFQPMNNFFVNKEGDKYKLRFGKGATRIEGFDVAELLELNMAFKEWKIVPLPEFNREHINAGSGYHESEEIAGKQRTRALNILRSRKLIPLGW